MWQIAQSAHASRLGFPSTLEFLNKLFSHPNWLQDVSPPPLPSLINLHGKFFPASSKKHCPCFFPVLFFIQPHLLQVFSIAHPWSWRNWVRVPESPGTPAQLGSKDHRTADPGAGSGAPRSPGPGIYWRSRWCRNPQPGLASWPKWMRLPTCLNQLLRRIGGKCAQNSLRLQKWV